MKLHKPVPTGTTSETANQMQHDVAVRIHDRVTMDMRKKRRQLFRKTFIRWLEIFALLAILGFGALVWSSGFLDDFLSALTH